MHAKGCCTMHILAIGWSTSMPSFRKFIHRQKIPQRLRVLIFSTLFSKRVFRKVPKLLYHMQRTLPVNHTFCKNLTFAFALTPVLMTNYGIWTLMQFFSNSSTYITHMKIAPYAIKQLLPFWIQKFRILDSDSFLFLKH